MNEMMKKIGEIEALRETIKLGGGERMALNGQNLSGAA